MDEINKAYSILKDDFSRAKYLNNLEPLSVSQEFLIEMLDYEDAISNITSSHQEQTIRNDLLQRIDQCKYNYSNAEYLSKWAYYERLIKILDESKITMQQ
ncbi:molecular chaperone [Ordospora colligata]